MNDKDQSNSSGSYNPRQVQTKTKTTKPKAGDQQIGVREKMHMALRKMITVTTNKSKQNDQHFE